MRPKPIRQYSCRTLLLGEPSLPPSWRLSSKPDLRPSPTGNKIKYCRPNYMWYYGDVKGQLEGCSLKFGVRGQRRKARWQNLRRSCSGRSGAQGARRKSLISMIIFGWFRLVLIRRERPSFPAASPTSKTTKNSPNNRRGGVSIADQDGWRSSIVPDQT